MKNEIEVDGVKYIRQQPNGNRCVVVADRGWVFAGDVEDKGGRVVLTRAVHVRRWESVGFDGMLLPENAGKVTLKQVAGGVDLPAASELFRVPVADDWGL